MDFRVLGPLEILDGGRPVPLGGTKQRAVLEMLLLRANTLVAADTLVEVVWGERPPERSRAVLQVYVANLRKALEPDRGRGMASTRIATATVGYRLRVGPGELDLDRFYRLVGEARELDHDAAAAARLSEAEGLWRGRAFPDLLGDVVPPELSRLEEDRLVALEDRLEAELASGQHEKVAGELAELVLEHPWRERLRRQRVLALYRSGRHAEALEAYRAARDELADELGIDPTPAFQALEQAILRHDPGLDTPRRLEPAGPATGKGQPGCLPVPPTRLIGRQQELLELGALLGRPGVRLVTLHGPGGAGKTRLAVAGAARVAGAYGGGVHFIPLAQVSDPMLVLPAIAAGLGFKEEAGNRPLIEALQAQLGGRPLLVVLDNFEQVVAAAPVVAELLDGVPSLTVLVTSRTALRLRAEQLYPVPPLPGADAEALFVERARAVCPSFVLDAAASAEVATICRQLDGLPLAIELAAARMRVIEPGQLLARLGRRLSLLTGGSRDVPQRHQTLRATIGWSYDLLPVPEQRLLAALSVFAGSGTLAAIETVCGADLDVDPLDGVQELVDNSLLRVWGGDGEPRYLMMHIVREFAAEQLAADPSNDQVRRRHAEFYLALAEQQEPELTAAGQRRAVQQLEAEYDNLRAALTWTRRAEEHDLALRLAGALGHFWEMTARFTEGRHFLSAALAPRMTESPAPRAKAVSSAGTLAFRQCDFDAATRCHQEALEIYRLLGDSEGTAFSLNNLAVQALEAREFDTGERMLEECLQLTRNPRLVCYVLSNLGENELARGNHVRATRWHERALQASMEIQDEWLTVIFRYNLAASLLHARSYRLARQHLHDGLLQAHALPDPSLVTEFIHAIASVCQRDGRALLAARLLGAVAALRSSTQAPPPPADAALYQAAADQVREELGARVFAREWDLGRAWDIDEAVTAAASAAGPDPPQPPGGR